MGTRPTNLIVDVANYVMFDLGQPLHTYDFKKLKFPIVVRRAKNNETLKTLDKIDRVLNKEDLLITDNNGSRIIGLAGVMGGQSTEIEAKTTDIFLEAAHFDTISISRTAKRHKLPSEASKRFARGVDTNIQINAIFLAAKLLVELGQGHIDKTIYELNKTASPKIIEFPTNLLKRLIGISLPINKVVDILRKIGCKIEIYDKNHNNQLLKVQVPTWRNDLNLAVDLCEEIARVWGYDKIPTTAPSKQLMSDLPRQNKLLRKLKNLLVNYGLTETYSYPFVGQTNFADLQINKNDPEYKLAIQLANPLQDKSPYIRTSILQTLLYTCQFNYSRGLENISLFEISQIAKLRSKSNQLPKLAGGKLPNKKDLGLIFANLPTQTLHVGGILTGNIRNKSWWGKARVYDWADCWTLVDQIAKIYNLDLELQNNNKTPYHSGISAKIMTSNNKIAGFMGALHPKVLQNLKLTEPAFAFELDLNTLLNSSLNKTKTAKNISPFPPARQDLAFVFDKSLFNNDTKNSLSAGRIEQTIVNSLDNQSGENIIESVELYDIYQGNNLAKNRISYTFAIQFRSNTKTLNENDLLPARQTIIQAVSDIGGQLRL
jgi:phenylalanyl-tRNA synthetase beta chain